MIAKKLTFIFVAATLAASVPATAKMVEGPNDGCPLLRGGMCHEPADKGGNCKDGQTETTDGGKTFCKTGETKGEADKREPKEKKKKKERKTETSTGD